MAESKKYEAITAEEHSQVEEFLTESINREFCMEKISENYFRYKVEIQEIKFVTELYTDEIKEAAKLTVDILEELKNITNAGINRAELDRIAEENDRQEPSRGNIMQIMGIWKSIKTERLSEIITELDRVMRVGGAWAMILANPFIISAIYAVYDMIVDKFDDDEIYVSSAYFLMRAVMKMHGTECPDEE